MHLDDIDTPALVLDLPRLRRNTERMSARASSAGVALRPHMKTAKSAPVAELAVRGHQRQITVSTLAEAEYFAANGFDDIIYAVCAVPAKLGRAARVQADTGARIHLITDHPAMARALAERSAALGARFSVLVEIDSGEHRTGVAWDSEALLETGKIIDAAPALELGGVLTHAGHSYAASTVDEVRRVAEQERVAVVGAAERLRAAGLSCPIVSAGSTPTAVHAESLEGVTELRPGVYVFFDLAQMGRGSCTADDIAVSVLATVIGHHPEHGRLLIDAGGIALSKDTSANAFVADAGYGWVVDIDTADRIADLRVVATDQEHGFVAGDIPFGELPIGSRVRVLPNHACMTASAHDRYHVVDGGRDVIAVWERANGW